MLSLKRLVSFQFCQLYHMLGVELLSGIRSVIRSDPLLKLGYSKSPDLYKDSKI